MADISNIITPDDNVFYFKDAASRENIQSIIDRNDYFEKYLSDIIGFAYATRGYTQTLNGVTVETLPDGLRIYGTSTASRTVVFLNGNSSIKTTSGTFVKTLDAGTYNIETDMTGYQTIYSFRATYTTFSNYQVIVSDSNKNATVTFTDPVMIGLYLSADRAYGTAEDPTYVSFDARRVPYADADNTSY